MEVLFLCELDVLLAEGRSLDGLSEAAFSEPHATLRPEISKI